MAVTAITGDIGAGKSTVSGIFADLMHCGRLDADKIAKDLWLRNDVKKIAVSRWGSEILGSSGNILMSEISRIIFASESEHNFCNSLIHPLVMLELHERSEGLKNEVIEIPLLPEAGRPEWIEKVIYVTADFKVRAERCRVRGWNDEELKRREKFLLPQNLRMSKSDYIIRNEGSLSELEHQAVSYVQENF